MNAEQILRDALVGKTVEGSLSIVDAHVSGDGDFGYVLVIRLSNGRIIPLEWDEEIPLS